MSAPCVACEGTGLKSRPGPGQDRYCVPCEGSGIQGGSFPDPEPQKTPMKKAPVQHSSTSNEFYTPADYIEAARELMGSIDCDPASCQLGQDVVKAEVWYGPGSPHGEDGLVEPWHGNVYLNPPGSKVPKEYRGLGTTSMATLFWALLVDNWVAGEVEQAIFMGFTLEILRSAQCFGSKDDPQILQPLDFHICVPSARIPFDTVNRPIERGKKKGQLIDPDKPEGTRVETDSPAHANVLVWLPPVTGDREGGGLGDEWLAEYKKHFEQFGKCR